MDQDVYLKKIVPFNYHRQSIQFRVSQDLFSSHQIDTGTRFLLRTLGDNECYAARRILDLGCGYGPIGLSLKMEDQGRTVHMVDRDALAVEFARQNARLNRVPDVKIYGSLGYDDVSANDFDLITSNIPGKAGESAIAHFLYDAVHYVRAGGMVAIVVIAPLEPMVTGLLNVPGIHVLLREERRGYVVFHYQFSDRPSDALTPGERGLQVYERGTMTVPLGHTEFSMQTARGLPEFDVLDHGTKLLLNRLAGMQGAAPGRALAFNPGQGHVPVALWKTFGSTTVLVDRDLLALDYSERNLVLNGCPTDRIARSHQAGLHLEQEPFDIICGTLREKEGPAAIALAVERAAEQLVPGGMMAIAASSTAVTRLEKLVRSEKKFRVEKRRRRQGKSLLVLRLK